MPEQGGEGRRPIPRSMGMTFEYIRRGMFANENQEAFGRRLQTTPSPFPESSRADPRAENPRSRISAYETAARDVCFGTQHRYGSLSKSYSGVIHLISLFYAFLRCAANEEEGSVESRREELRQAMDVAIRLEALAEEARRLVAVAQEEFESSRGDLAKVNPHGLLEGLRGEDEAWVDEARRLQRQMLVIKPLFDAYLEALQEEESECLS